MKNHTQHLDHQQIKALLNRSTEQLDGDILYSLRQARTAALHRQRVPAPVFTLSAVGHRASAMLPHSTGQWLTACLLLAALTGSATAYWHHQQAQQLSHLDIAILTDDLPIKIFID